MWYYNYSDPIAHDGVLGMKWGIRNYLKKRGKKNSRKAAIARKKAGIKEESGKPEPKKKVSEMSDAELKAAVQRLENEKKYRDLNPRHVSAGEKFAKDFVEKALIPGINEGAKQIIKDALVSKGGQLIKEAKAVAK